MNVKDLKAVLQNLPDDMLIILQKDAEGNGWSPLYGTDQNCIYVPDSAYSGKVYSTTWEVDDTDRSEDEWKKLKAKNDRALVLFPAN